MQKSIVVIVLIAVLLISAILLGAYPAPLTGLAERLALEAPDIPVLGPDDSLSADTSAGRLRLAFSETGHFYDTDIEVEITASLPGAEIYYTLGGAEPTTGSDLYTGPISFPAPGGVAIFVLKAIAVRGDAVTRPLVHTYFVGRGVDARFDTLVFSLSTDPEHLYDYDTGIFVEGRLRADYIAENPRVHINPPAPANFNLRGREGERPVYVEVFEPDGTRVVAQAAGLRVHGGWSRAESQKSLRLIARNEYEPGLGKFHYGFFPDETVNDAYGTPLSKYDSIVLRNGANDRSEAMLRNEAASVMARAAGFREVTPMRPCAVFLNGVYHGFSWLQVSINEQYLQDIYGTPTRDFDIVGNGEDWLETDDSALRADLRTLNSYANKDLTDGAVFAELEEILDIDNFLWYYAYQIYMGNDDWPGNNLKRWRYTGAPFEGMAPEADGRWRYILFDLDWTLGLYNDSPSKATFRNVLGGSKSSPLLVSVLKRPDMADKFTMILCDIAHSLVTEKNVPRVIDALYAEAAREIGIAIDARKYAFWVSRDSVKEHHGRMISYAERRGDYILRSLGSYFGYIDDLYIVEVYGSRARLGTLTSGASRYFTALTVPVSPVLDKFEVFDHWLLNGQRIDEPDITVSVQDARNGVVTLELVTREETPALILGEAYAGQRNGCVLVNTTDRAVSTAGLYLSDLTANPFRWQIPAATIPPGGTLTLAGAGSSDPADLLNIRMSFNVSAGEVLTLADGDGVIWDYRAVR